MSKRPAKSLRAVDPYDLYLLTISVVSIGVVAADTLMTLADPMHDLLDAADTSFCVLFAGDFAWSMYRAEDRWRYFRQSGWLDLLSSVPTFGLLRLGRLARIARLIRLLRAMRSLRAIGQIVSRHRAASAMSAAAIVCILLALFGSIAVLGFETDPQSNIKTGGDALWWAFTTITTVGYGDRYPVTLEGRVIAAMLMAAGVGLFGALSGLVASWFLNAGQSEDTNEIQRLSHEVAQLRVLLQTHIRVSERPAVEPDVAAPDRH